MLTASFSASTIWLWVVLRDLARTFLSFSDISQNPARLLAAPVPLSPLQITRLIFRPQSGAELHSSLNFSARASASREVFVLIRTAAGFGWVRINCPNGKLHAGGSIKKYFERIPVGRNEEGHG